MAERCPDPKCNSRFKERRFCVTDHVRNIPRPHCFVQDDCMECTDPWHGVASEPAPTPVHKYAGWPGRAMCGAMGESASTANDDVTCGPCKAVIPSPAVERPTEQACSMSGRIDLGHGKDGHCDITGKSCPTACLLKQIENLWATVRGSELELSSTRTRLESELSSLRRELANRSTNELWYASERQKLEARVEELKAALRQLKEMRTKFHAEHVLSLEETTRFDAILDAAVGTEEGNRG